MALPTKLLDLANTCLGKTGFDEKDIYRGDQLEVWLREIPFGQELPTEYVINIAAAIAEDDLIASLALADPGALTLYKGDVLWVNDPSDPINNPGQIIIISGTREITDTASDVPIYAQNTAVAAASTSLSYGMKPNHSIESGGMPQSTGTIAESRNRQQNLFTVKAVYQRSANSSIEGTAIRNDPSLAVLENASQDNSRLYFETRRPPYDGFGAGFNAKKYKAIVESSSPTSSASEHSKVNFSLAITGSFSTYTPLGMDLEYMKVNCPEDLYLAGLNDNNC